MPARRLAAIAATLLAAATPLAAPARADATSANTAALQVALRALHLYKGGIDGVKGPKTTRAVRRFQRRKHLTVDGVAGPRTRRALGRRGRPRLGSRTMRRGHRGWDVAALQFMLKRRGFRPRSVDGGFGANTSDAVRRAQRAAGIAVDGRAGRMTLRALRSAAGAPRSGAPSGPVRFFRPVRGPMGDGFGYPGGRRHTGIDFPVPYGTTVQAAGRGTISFAGWNSGGYGYLIIVQHRLGFQTWYAHLSAITRSRGAAVSGGTPIGRVGSTGRSTGPHLHFEVRLNGVPIDPMPRLLSSTAAGVLERSPLPHGDVECPPHGDAGSDAEPDAHVDPSAGEGDALRPIDPATVELPACAH